MTTQPPLQTLPVHGLLLINKSKGISSFGVIKQLKKLLPKKTKIGHAGTLDPFATGLLIVAISRQATRLMTYLIKLDKTYRAMGKIGELTDTLDRTGMIIQTDTATVSPKHLQEAIDKIGSKYCQIPPIISALKYQGQPLYKLAKQNLLSYETLEQITQHKKRTVSIYRLNLTEVHDPFFIITTQVSHGTYIRTLVNDIAQTCNTIATTYELERTCIGPFSLDQAQSIEEFGSLQDIQKHLIPVEQAITLLEQNETPVL